MVKTKLIILITFLIMIIVPSMVYGLYEDFELKGAKEISILGCVTSRDGVITVTNTGTIASGYKVSVGGSGASFIALGPKSFVLEPGKSQEVLTYFTADCDAQGEYDLDIYVNTVLDAEKKIEQKLIVEKPQNIEIIPVSYVNQIKPCNLAPYSFIIKNNGVFQETYTIEFDRPMGKYVSVNFNQITLGAGQQVVFDFYVNPSCDMYGNYTIPFSIVTSKTKLSAKTFAYLIVDRDYEYSLKLGGAYPYTNLTTSFSEHSSEELYSLCTNSKEIIPLKITNDVEIPNTYSINLESPSWVKLAGNKLELNNSQEGISGLVINTNDIEGDFSVAINVVSKYGEIEKTKNVILSVENCYEPEIMFLDEKKNVVVDYNPVKIPLNIKNRGLRTADYIISLEGEPWLSLESNSIKVAPGQIGVINIVSTPDEFTNRGSYDVGIKVNVKDSGVEYKDAIKIKLVTMNIFDKFYYDVLKPYLVYFLLSIVLLVLLLLVLFLVIKKQMKKPKKEKIKKIKVKKIKKVSTSKKSEKLAKIFKNKKFWFFLILIILLLAIIGLSLFLFKDQIFTGVNETIEPVEEEVSESIFSKIKDSVVVFLADYWIYFAVGLGILLLLIIILFVIKKLHKKGVFKKKEKIIVKKVKVKKIRKKINWKKLKPSKKTQKRLWIILAILLLVGLGFLIYYFWPGEAIANAWGNRTIFVEKNITEVVPEDNVTKIPVLEKVKSFFTSPFFVSIKDFFVTYLNYILYAIVGLVVLALLILLILVLLKRFKKSRMTEFEAGSVDKEIILKNAKMAFGEVILKLKRPAYSVGLLMRKVNKPTFIRPEGKVYEYAEIKKENIDDSNIDKIIIRFKVKKSWLKRYNIKKSDISLKRYHNQWVGVNTKNISEDEKYYYYESILNQVGSFAIVGKITPIIKEQKVVIAKKPKKIKVKKARKKLDKKKLKKFFWFVILLLLLIVLAGLIFFFWASIVAFILLYMWFILGAIAALVLLVLLVWLIKWLKKKKFKLKYKTKKRLLGLLSILLLIIAILLLLMYLRPVFVGLANENRTITVIEEVIIEEVCEIPENVSRDELTEEDLEECEILIETETKYISKRLGDNILFRDEVVKVEMLEEGRVEEREIIVPIIIPDEPSVIISSTDGIPDQEWNEETNLTIKLNRYFNDPDRDELYYTNTELKNIKVSYIDGSALLVPKKNWYGTEFVIFTAKDMKGGEVDSNLVKLTVLDVPESNVFVKLWEWLK